MKNTHPFKLLLLSLFLFLLPFGLIAKNTRPLSNPLPLGVVEGFYKEPWSHQDRLSIIQFMGHSGMNYYIYAPKDDLYHRDKWREPYPPEQMNDIKELIRTSAQYRVRFCFAISPGKDIHYSSDSDFSVLMSKLDTFYRLGVRDFALFLDDISDQLQYPEDTAIFKSYGDAHVYLTNKLYTELKKKNPAIRLIFCPTEYYKLEHTPYLDTIGNGIKKDIPIIWTGEGVTSPTIYTDQLLKIRTILKRKPFIWDNYPVNDYGRDRLYLGPIIQRTPSLSRHISGYVANPMNEAELSKIPLYTIARFFQNPYEYAPEKIWQEGILNLGGFKGYRYLREFCEENRSSFLTHDDSVQTGVLVADYLNDPTVINSSKLKKRMELFISLPEKLDKTVSNKKMLKEMKPYTEKLALYGKTGLLAMQIISSDKVKESDPVWLEFKKGIVDLKSYPIFIAELPMSYLFRAAMDKGFHDMGLAIPQVTSTIPAFGNNIPEQMVDGDTTTWFWGDSGS